jgi:short-subunit dehydrogenase
VKDQGFSPGAVDFSAVLEGRTMETVLVTGASSGIGLELAKVFAENGSHLVLTARREEKLEQLAEQIRRDCGVEVLVLAADLSDPASPSAILEEVRKREMVVDVVVNNAGFGVIGPFCEQPLQRQLDVLQVNLVALTHLTRLFLPAMVERGRGGILNVASTAAFQPGPGMAVYFATKAYVLSLTEALAEELLGTGVTASCLAPGPTATEFESQAEMDGVILFRLGTMTARNVAKSGYKGFRRGKVVVVPRVTNKLAAFATRFAPRIVVRKVTKVLLSGGATENK